MRLVPNSLETHDDSDPVAVLLPGMGLREGGDKSGRGMGVVMKRLPGDEEASLRHWVQVDGEGEGGARQHK